MFLSQANGGALKGAVVQNHELIGMQRNERYARTSFIAAKPFVSEHD